jgi:hypothetical protein
MPPVSFNLKATSRAVARLKPRDVTTARSHDAKLSTAPLVANQSVLSSSA